MGGMSIPIFAVQASFEYQNSIIMTRQLSENIVNQVKEIGETDCKQELNQIKARKKLTQSLLLEQLRNRMDDLQKRLNDLASEKGASSWLTILPIKDEGYLLNKQLFWDLIRIRYGLQLAKLPAKCECGCVFDLHHALSCKKGEFVSLRHNELKNLTTKLLKEVCKDVLLGTKLSKRFANQNFQKAYETNEKEKKKPTTNELWKKNMVPSQHHSSLQRLEVWAENAANFSHDWLKQLQTKVKRNEGRRFPGYDERYRSRYVVQ